MKILIYFSKCNNQGTTKRWPITSLHPFGSLEEEIGSVYELETQTKAILADNNVTNSEFSEAVQSCLPPLSFDCGSDIDNSRRDLRDNTVTFTIDPKGSNGKMHILLNKVRILFVPCIVLDDALSIKKVDKGTWEIGVHVSDVTYFIKSQTPLDKEARARGVRVDLVHSHVPMIPEVLTEQITNLVPNKSRYIIKNRFKNNMFNIYTLDLHSLLFGRLIVVVM
jgi:protein SSD1